MKQNKRDRHILTFCITIAVVLCAVWYLPPALDVHPLSPEIKASMDFLRFNTPDQQAYELYYVGVLKDWKPTYGVLSWWDYGNYIIRLGRRLPYSSPANQYNSLQDFFVAQTTEQANRIIEGKDVKYVMITKPMTEQIFPAIAVGFPKSGLWVTVKDWRALREQSMVYRLYNSEGFDQYKLVFMSPNIKIFEVVK